MKSPKLIQNAWFSVPFSAEHIALSSWCVTDSHSSDPLLQSPLYGVEALLPTWHISVRSTNLWRYKTQLMHWFEFMLGKIEWWFKKCNISARCHDFKSWVILLEIKNMLTHAFDGRERKGSRWFVGEGTKFTMHIKKCMQLDAQESSLLIYVVCICLKQPSLIWQWLYSLEHIKMHILL